MALADVVKTSAITSLYLQVLSRAPKLKSVRIGQVRLGSRVLLVCLETKARGANTAAIGWAKEAREEPWEMSKGYWRDVSDVWTIPPAKILGAPGDCVPGAPSIRIFIRSAGAFAVTGATRDAW